MYHSLLPVFSADVSINLLFHKSIKDSVTMSLTYILRCIHTHSSDLCLVGASNGNANAVAT